MLTFGIPCKHQSEVSEMISRLRVFAVLLAAAVWATVPAHADNTSATNAHTNVLGEVHSTTFGTATPSRWYKAGLTQGRSYTAFAWAPEAEQGAGTITLQLSWFLDDGTTPVTNGTPGQVFSPMVEPSLNSTGHSTQYNRIVPASTGTFRLDVVTVGGSVSSTPGRVVVVETTLFSPWYFVNATNGYDGFIEIRNNSSAAVTAVVTVFRNTGTVAGTSSPSIPANGTVIVQASSLNPDGFGSVQIAHNGAPGAISANITTLSAMTGLSFDAPFTPRPSWNTFGP
jgi:hypothetical protein